MFARKKQKKWEKNTPWSSTLQTHTFSVDLALQRRIWRHFHATLASRISTAPITLGLSSSHQWSLNSTSTFPLKIQYKENSMAQMQNMQNMSKQQPSYLQHPSIRNSTLPTSPAMLAMAAISTTFPCKEQRRNADSTIDWLWLIYNRTNHQEMTHQETFLFLDLSRSPQHPRKCLQISY